MPANEIEVTIGSVQLNQSLSPGNSFYVLHNTPELLSSLSTRQTEKEKQGGHGTEDSLSFYGARILRFEGEIHAASQTARITMENALKTAVGLAAAQDYEGDDGYKLLLITDEDGVAKQIYAKVLEPPRFSLIDNAIPESRRFEFTMYAKNPVLYGQSVTSVSGPESFLTTTFTIVDGALPTFKDGALPTIQDDTDNEMSATNSGSHGTEPVLTVSGPAENPIITNATTGKKMAFTLAGGVTLLSGETLTINVATRTIIKTDTGGSETDESGKLSTDSEWIFIEPGANVFTLFDDSPDELVGQLQIDFRPAYV